LFTLSRIGRQSEPHTDSVKPSSQFLNSKTPTQPEQKLKVSSWFRCRLRI